MLKAVKGSEILIGRTRSLGKIAYMGYLSPPQTIIGLNKKLILSKGF